MFLEPWGFLPSDVAELTFDQMEGLYRRPAIERSKALEREMRGGGNRPTTVLPDKAGFVASMLANVGGTPEQWEADYDRLVTEWENPS